MKFLLNELKAMSTIRNKTLVRLREIEVCQNETSTSGLYTRIVLNLKTGHRL